MKKIDHFEEHHADQCDDSALFINPGVGKQPIVNPNFKRTKRQVFSTEDFFEGIVASDIMVLSQAITLVESVNPVHHAQAQTIIERCLPFAGRSIRIGITGVPGAGKSTFIEAVGSLVAGRGHRLAVLAIDPSSQRSKGSILGDKTRMETISSNPNIFIRPSPAAGSLGGVARKTRESIVLCEAAGFDVIIIETVGVGQSETAVHSMVDLFMMLQIGGAGDELQGIKRGIMEMADLVAITKADGENVDRANLAKAQITNALHLFPMPESGDRPQVLTCSAITGEGIERVWNGVEKYIDTTKSNGFFEVNRNNQGAYWMHETINRSLLDAFYANPQIEALLPEYEQRISLNQITSFVAARELLDLVAQKK